MKIGLLNFYFANNYGATLQCYALYTTLRKMGNEVDIIDYRFGEMLEAYHMPSGAIKRTFLRLSSEKKNPVYCLKLANRLFKYYSWYFLHWKSLIKMKNFNKFINKEFSETFQHYKNYSELVNNPPICECYIAGSDQIWNTDNLGGKLDNSFFLEFGPPNTKRIIYGASCGMNVLSEEYIEDILSHCKNIQFISVREDSLLKQLTGKTKELKIYKVCDPVFLLDKHEWNIVRVPTISVRKKYIVLYILNQVNNLQNIIKHLKTYYKNFVICDISYRKNNVRGIDYWDGGCGPGHFLDYIGNAELIITDSFHGTAFSIIYQKSFISLIRADTGVRVLELLSKFNLTNRIYNPAQTMEHYASAINYSYVEKRIIEEKEHSLEYLYNSLYLT